MPVSLHHHSLGYRYDSGNLLWGTSPYTERRREIAKLTGNRGDQLLFRIGQIPAIGLIAALFEVIVAKLWRRMCGERPIDRIYRDSIEVISSKETLGYASLVEGALPPLPSLEKSTGGDPLQFRITQSGFTGIKKGKTDGYSLFREEKTGLVAIVTDGTRNGDVETHHVAGIVALYIKQNFFEQLVSSKGNVSQAMESIIGRVQRQIAKREDWNGYTSTLVFSYVDKKTRVIYTATIGDSRGYRIGGDGNQRAIPLSPIHNWDDPSVRKRLEERYGKEAVTKLTQDGGGVRLPPVSRALGNTKGGSILSREPTITINRLEPGDRLILAPHKPLEFLTPQDLSSIESANSLVEKARNKGLVDDAVAIVIDVY